LIAKTVIQATRRSGPQTPEFVDDAIQETYLRICQNKILSRFKAEEPGRIYGLIQAVAYSTAQDSLKAARALKRGGNVRTISHEESSAPEMGGAGAAEMEREVLLREVEAVLEKAVPADRDRHVFWLYYRHGLTAKAISQIPSLDLGAKGVESIIHRLTAEMRRRMTPVNKAPLKGREGISG
jgi:RNA polymerase sigma-70 factor (ECF subfamily)